MKAATPAEKNTQQTEDKKKKKRQVEAAQLPVRHTEIANAQTQKPDAPTNGNAEEPARQNAVSHNGIPAVHGAESAYSQGAERMYQQLRESLQLTGDLNHPDTQKKEMNYKMTLGIDELREYHSIKSDAVKPVVDAKPETSVSKPETVKTDNVEKAKPQPQDNVKQTPSKPAVKAGAAKEVETAAGTAIHEIGTVTDYNIEASTQIPAAQTESHAKEANENHANNASSEQKDKQLPHDISKNNTASGSKTDHKQGTANNTSSGLLSSLAHSSATSLAADFNAVQDQSAEMLKSQGEKSSGNLPTVKASQGSAFSKSKAGKKQPVGKSVSKKGKKAVTSAPLKPAKAVAFPDKMPLKKTDNALSKNGKIDQQAQRQLDAISLNTASIPLKMQEHAIVDLSGQADTDNVSIEHNDTLEDLSIKKEQASKDIHKDYGENDIIKEPSHEVLKTDHKFKARNIKMNKIKGFNPEGLNEADINNSFAPVIQSKIGAENDKFEAAKLEHDQKVLSEETTAQSKIQTEESKSKEKQSKSVSEAHADVNKSRGEWQQELNKTEADFTRKAGAQAKTTMGSIKTEKATGEAAAQKHIDSANKDAAAEKAKADKDARQKQQATKQESKGFFGWLAEKATAFINALKDALNFIFTKLREAVKAIFELAKKLVLAALELARKAIVGLIKGFAMLLKGFLDFALAGFPALRDRLKAKIDKYVATAEKLVNQVFEMFKKAVTAIIDFLAETIDKALGLMQSIYEGILTVVGMIVSGDIVALLNKLGNIKDALFAITFDTIKQGGMEELLGADLDESLSPEELMAAMQMGLLSGGGQDADAGMPKAPWTNANVGVDAISFEELSPEMQAELRRMQKGGQTEATLGQRNDPERTMDSVMNEVNTPKNADAPGQKFNDGLTPMKRAEIKWEMMKSGIKKWWDDNWLKVIGGIVAALVVFIAAEALTGGAITAALPVLMPILEEVFVGVMVAQFAGYLTDGLGKSWNGDIKGGTKAFSRGLGAALIELAMYLGFKAIELAAKGITKVVKGVFKLVKSAAKSVMDFGKFIIKEGKVLFKGIAGKNLGKLGKSLRKFGDDILEHTRLKKFRIRLEGRRFLIEGFINPWVLMASGDLKEIEDVGKTRVGQSGKFITKEGEEIEGMLVTAGKEKNAFTQSIADDLKDGKEAYEKLLTKTDVERNASIFGGKAFDYEKAVKEYGKDVADAIRKKGNLAKSLDAAPGEFSEAHHIFPVELLEQNEVLQKAVREGFEFNGKGNGKWLKHYSSQDINLLDGVHASHPQYTQRVNKLVNDIMEQNGKMLSTLRKGEAKAIIEEVNDIIRKTIDESPMVKINDLIFRL